MQPHQQRVVDEHDDLKSKLDKLNAFTKGPTWLTIPYEERELLVRQSRAMESYLSILAKRMALWGKV
jgi:hypothetical protein